MPESISNPFGWTPDTIDATVTAFQAHAKGENVALRHATENPGQGLNTTADPAINDKASMVYAIVLNDAAIGQTVRVRLRGEADALVLRTPNVINSQNSGLAPSVHRVSTDSVRWLVPIAEANTPSAPSGLYKTPAIVIDVAADAGISAAVATPQVPVLISVLFDGLNGYGMNIV